MKRLIANVIHQASLTDKEAEVLRYLCEGCSRAEIAKSKIHRSTSTINRHIENIAFKLESHSHADIVATAVALNMVEIHTRPEHPALQFMCVMMLLVNVAFGHLEMRGPRSPRPIRTGRTLNRIIRTSRQFF